MTAPRAERGGRGTGLNWTLGLSAPDRMEFISVRSRRPVVRDAVPVSQPPGTSTAQGAGSRSVIACGRRHSLAVLADGTVAATGSDAAGECAVADWRDVVAVAAGNVHAARNTGRSDRLRRRG